MSKKISQLTQLTSPAPDDKLIILDQSASETKSITISSLLGENTTDWTAVPQTLTYASSTTVTTSGDYTASYQKGDKFRLVNNGATKYFYLTNIVFSGGNTTFTLFGGTSYTLTNATITSPSYSRLANPIGFPRSMNFAVNWTSTGSAPSIGNGTLTGTFRIVEGLVFPRYKFVGGSTTNYGSGNYILNLPVTPNSALSANDGFALGGYMEDSGVNGFIVTGARLINTPDTFYVLVSNDTSGGTYTIWANSSPFVWSTNDYWSANGFYDF